MKTRLLLLIAVGSLPVLGAAAADWPQWRGPNRDAKVTDFKAPSTWPKELTKKWSEKIGNGVATPALVGDKLYTFSREDPEELVRCLDANTGKEIWKQSYKADKPTGPPGPFPGPRSSPTVADGKVVTLGASGTLTCWDAANGKQVWKEDKYVGRDNIPMFWTSSSPIIADGLCIVQLGGRNGLVAAYELATGKQKWERKTDGATAYASPVLLTVGGTKLVLAQLANRIAILQAADGKHVLDITFTGDNASSYKAATPIVDGQTVIYSNGNPKAVKIDKQGDEFTTKDLWTDEKDKVEFNTPTLKGNHLFGISGTYEFFCFDVQSGKTLWTAPAPRPSGGAMAGGGGGKGGGKSGGKGGPPGKGGGRGMGGRPEGYGSIVDAGSVLFALTPAGQLLVVQPSDKEYKEVAKYKVGEFKGPGKGTYAYPIVAGNRIYIKDDDSVTLWTIN